MVLYTCSSSSSFSLGADTQLLHLWGLAGEAGRVFRAGTEEAGVRRSWGLEKEEEEEARASAISFGQETKLASSPLLVEPVVLQGALGHGGRGGQPGVARGGRLAACPGGEHDLVIQMAARSFCLFSSLERLQASPGSMLRMRSSWLALLIFWLYCRAIRKTRFLVLSMSSRSTDSPSSREEEANGEPRPASSPGNRLWRSLSWLSRVAGRGGSSTRSSSSRRKLPLLRRASLLRMLLTVPGVGSGVAGWAGAGPGPGRVQGRSSASTCSSTWSSPKGSGMFMMGMVKEGVATAEVTGGSGRCAGGLLGVTAMLETEAFLVGLLLAEEVLLGGASPEPTGKAAGSRSFQISSTFSDILSPTLWHQDYKPQLERYVFQIFPAVFQVVLECQWPSDCWRPTCSAEDDPEMSLLDDSVWITSRSRCSGGTPCSPAGRDSLAFSPALLARRRTARPAPPAGGSTCTAGTCSTCQLQGRADRGDEGGSGPSAGGVSGSGPLASVGMNICALAGGEHGPAGAVVRPDVPDWVLVFRRHQPWDGGLQEFLRHIRGPEERGMATVILVVGILRVRFLPFLSVAVIVVITWVQGFLGLVDEAAAAADRAQGQLGHRGEQGGPKTRPLGWGDKDPHAFVLLGFGLEAEDHSVTPKGALQDQLPVANQIGALPVGRSPGAGSVSEIPGARGRNLANTLFLMHSASTATDLRAGGFTDKATEGDRGDRVLHVGALRVQDLLHHAVHIGPGPLHWALHHIRAQVWFRVSCGSLPSPAVRPPRDPTAAAPAGILCAAAVARPLLIPIRLPLAPQLAGRDQLQPDGPRVPVGGRRWRRAGAQRHGAPDQRAVAVPRRGRRGGGAVADWPLRAVRGGVHAVGGAVAQRHVAGGGEAQCRSGHLRDFWERRQRIRRQPHPLPRRRGDDYCCNRVLAAVSMNTKVLISSWAFHGSLEQGTEEGSPTRTEASRFLHYLVSAIVTSLAMASHPTLLWSSNLGHRLPNGISALLPKPLSQSSRRRHFQGIQSDTRDIPYTVGNARKGKLRPTPSSSYLIITHNKTGGGWRHTYDDMI
ncbi:LOW QUALITY PROTEIN: hypothetical protein CRUP_014677 [Coryphaenoides rupestris]|nr:LOW QUALITY PROTEIN: hypothetical protein CRUP_014677 [Coryphaenoides rupestris]